MNLRYVVVVSLVFVTWNELALALALERQELAWKRNSFHDRVEIFKDLFIKCSQSVAFLVPNLGMSPTLLSP